MLETIITAILSFASTNIDDIFVLMILYAQVNEKMKKRDIVLGQYLGIGILVALSILGAFGLHFLPQKYTGALGLLPIALGIKSWVDHQREKKVALPQTEEFIAGHLPQSGDDTTITDKETDSDEPTEADEGKINQKCDQVTTKMKSLLLKVIKPEILSVTAVTMANGADNIGIYTPIFINYSIWELIVTGSVFMVMIAIWCLAGDKLANYPLIKTKIQKYKHIIVPVVFVGLGIFIILESGILSFMF